MIRLTKHMFDEENFSSNRINVNNFLFWEIGILFFTLRQKRFESKKGSKILLFLMVNCGVGRVRT